MNPETYFKEMREIGAYFGYNITQPHPASAPFKLEAKHTSPGNWVELQELPRSFIINPGHWDVGEPTEIIENRKLFLLSLKAEVQAIAINTERQRIKNILGL